MNLCEGDGPFDYFIFSFLSSMLFKMLRYIILLRFHKTTIMHEIICLPSFLGPYLALFLVTTISLDSSEAEYAVEGVFQELELHLFSTSSFSCYTPA